MKNEELQQMKQDLLNMKWNHYFDGLRYGSLSEQDAEKIANPNEQRVLNKQFTDKIRSEQTIAFSPEPPKPKRHNE